MTALKVPLKHRVNFWACWTGPENGHETAFELVSGANFGNLRARPVGTGPGAKFGRKPTKNQIEITILITYSKRRLLGVAVS